MINLTFTVAETGEVYGSNQENFGQAAWGLISILKDHFGVEALGTPLMIRLGEAAEQHRLGEKRFEVHEWDFSTPEDAFYLKYETTDDHDFE